jgi:pyrroline-5-carboxylate reductase
LSTSTGLVNCRLGFIGAGNMANAFIRGILSRGIVPPGNIYVYDIDMDKLNKLCAQLGVQMSDNNSHLASNSDIIILAVKPNMYSKVLDEIMESLSDDKILLSIAAGITVDYIKDKIGNKCKVIRTMPNTPALVGEGVIALSTYHDLTSDQRERIRAILSSLGMVVEVPENLMNAVTALSGSGPAYVSIFIEAMADGGVLAGLPREQAYRMAAQTVLGTAKLLLEWGLHPGELKDAVCTPAGTTIEAVRELEKHGFRGAVIEAVNKCANKAEIMEKAVRD